MKYLLIALALVAGSVSFVAPSSAQIFMLSFADGSTTPPTPPEWCPNRPRCWR